MNICRFLIYLVLFVFAINTDVYSQRRVVQNEDLFYFTNDSLGYDGVVRPMLYYYNEKPQVDLRDSVEKSKLKKCTSWLNKHLFYDNFLVFSGDNFSTNINPIFVFESYFDKNEQPKKNYSRNTRGFEIFGTLGSRISYYSSFYENQAFFPSWIMDYSEINGVLPGQGHAKEYKEDGLDWAWSTGSVVINCVKNKYLVDFGQGKLFIGSGYRSMVLSYNSFNYPYIRHCLNFFNNTLHYTIVDMQTQSKGFGFATFDDREYRYASYHILEYTPKFGLDISLIEGVMWRNKMDDNYTTRPQMLMFLPIIGVATLKNNLNGGDNCLVALDVAYQKKNYFKFYSQLMLNGKHNNAMSESDNYWGGQIGLHVYDAFLNKFDFVKWHIQGEINFFHPENIDEVENAFCHYGQSLMYDYELIGDKILFSDILLFNRAEVSAKIIESQVRFEGKYKHSDVRVSFMANNKTKWRFYVGVHNRKIDNLQDLNLSSNKYFYFGTSICPEKFYWDF